ncbi:MAG: hypothetical protein BWY11_00190 [Firmicutes bacterium ADurb.Bin182]|nr:MAG: hypothetical protein BWY11_00190 [Firmicutes bacterium ADurb.Bin182]
MKNTETAGPNMDLFLRVPDGAGIRLPYAGSERKQKIRNSLFGCSCSNPSGVLGPIEYNYYEIHE